MTQKIKKLIQNSKLIRAKEIEPSYKCRSLTQEEIHILHNNLNSCEDWSKIQVAQDFDPKAIKNSTFSGEVYLPNFFGSVMTSGSIPVATGIYSSFINNSIIENSHIHGVNMLSQTFVSQGASIRNVGSIVCSGKTRFGLENPIYLGDETGTRRLFPFPEIDIDTASYIIDNVNDPEFDVAYQEIVDSYLEQITSPYTFIGKEVILCNTTVVRNAWIGTATRIDGATKIRSSCILSSREQPTGIFDNAIVENSVLQWGVRVHSTAHVSHSVMLEESSASKQVKVLHSVIGYNTHPQSGEVTSSLVGPFVGMHHQSLLISAIWPEGCGNIGYGANVGSNHTGRLPDQEIQPGEGNFFGLGMNVKFPANFKESPWSLFATGITTLPQKISFPFSLIQEGNNDIPESLQHLNQILPCWTFENNAFALERNQIKFQKRNKARRPTINISIFSDTTAKYVIQAINNLVNIATVKNYYTEHDIPGLGKNYLTEVNRQKAIVAYKFYMERYTYRKIIEQLCTKEDLLQETVPIVKKLFRAEVMKQAAKIISFPAQTSQLIKKARGAEKKWIEKIEVSMEKDFIRGKKIFDDYEKNHSRDNDNIKAIRDEFEVFRKRCNNLLTQTKY